MLLASIKGFESLFCIELRPDNPKPYYDFLNLYINKKSNIIQTSGIIYPMNRKTKQKMLLMCLNRRSMMDCVPQRPRVTQCHRKNQWQRFYWINVSLSIKTNNFMLSAFLSTYYEHFSS